MSFSTMLSVYSFVVVATLVSTANCKDFLPSYIKPCSYKDTDVVSCIKAQIETSLPKFTKGIPELGVPSTDPVSLDDIVIDGNGLKLIFTQAAMHGLSGAKLSELKVSIGKLDEAFKLAFKADLSVLAKYEADGRILILPIKGKGDAKINTQGVLVTIDSKLSHVKDDKGEEHFKLVSPTYKYTIEKTTFEFQNLFNGNKQLSDTTHQFANENWRQLMDDLAPPVIKQIVRTVVKTINKFFTAVTIKQIVSDYDVRP